MKKITLLILIALLFSCNSSTSKNSNTPKEEKSKIERDYEIADMFLQFDSEKIGLISILKNIPPEKANSVLRDYLAKTMISIESMEDTNYIVKLVDTISKKNNLSKKLTASIIFSYQYEMITRDEIIDSYQDEMIDYQNDMEQY